MAASEPFSWLSCDSDYELPADFKEAVTGLPEQEALRIWRFHGGPAVEQLFAWFGAVYFDPDYGSLPQIERTLIATIVSSTNRCVACLTAHGHTLGELMGDHARAKRIGINYRHAPLSARERAIADYAVKLTKTPAEVDHVDVDALRAVGLSDQEIYQVAEITAMFNFTNRIVSGVGLRVDDDFMAAIAPKNSTTSS